MQYYKSALKMQPKIGKPKGLLLSLAPTENSVLDYFLRILYVELSFSTDFLLFLSIGLSNRAAAKSELRPSR